MKTGLLPAASDDGKFITGIIHNAAMRDYGNYFDLSVEGGTTETLNFASIAPGGRVRVIVIESDANLSGITFAIGTVAAPNKYGTALAGPNATQQTRYPPMSLKLDAITAQEDLILTPSAALPTSGGLRVSAHVTHR